MVRKSMCLGACLLGLLSACDDKPPEPPAKPPSHAQSPAPGDQPVDAPKRAPATAPTAAPAAAAINWTKPAAWEDVPSSSPMRKATYKIKAAEGDKADAEMSVTQVGGSVEANIKRWEGQFAEAKPAKTSDSTVNGLKVTVVELEGTFSGGGPAMGGESKPTPDYALLGAIVHTQPAFFFKMTGPKKTVQGSRGDFDGLVASFAEKK